MISGAARSGVAVAVLAYACVVLMRPLNGLLQVDPASVNPPGGAGQFLAAVRLVYTVLVPALYGLSGILVFAGSRSARRLFSLALIMEVAVGFSYLYLASAIDVPGARLLSRWVLGGAYFLAPAALLLAVFSVTREGAEKAGA